MPAGGGPGVFLGGVTVAGLLAVAVIGHGLFVNGPVDDPADLADEVDALN